MATKDNVLLSSDPVFKDVLLEMLEGCRDLREATARMSETVLNALMSMQADEACGATWGERSEERVNSRNGYRERGLSTTAGELTLEVPKLRKGTYFPDDILRRWGRADAALAAAITEMYARGVPAGKVEAVARKLGLDSMSSSRVSSMCASLDAEVDEFRTRPLGWQRWCYLWLDATWARCRVEGRSVSQAIVTAIALGEDGCKHFCGADVMDTESYADWDRFLANLRDRGLDGVQLVVSDAHGGLKRAIAERFQGASWQRCYVHLMRDVAGHVRNRHDQARAVELLRAVFAQRDPLVARAALRRAAGEIESFSPAAAACLAGAQEDCLVYMDFPSSHWRKIRTNNVQERANREIKRRAKVVQSFPSRGSLVRLVGAVLIGEEDAWSQRRMFSREVTAEAWNERRRPVPTELELKTAERRAADVVAEALDQAGRRS